MSLANRTSTTLNKTSKQREEEQEEQLKEREGKGKEWRAEVRVWKGSKGRERGEEGGRGAGKSLHLVKETGQFESNESVNAKPRHAEQVSKAAMRSDGHWRVGWLSKKVSPKLRECEVIKPDAQRRGRGSFYTRRKIKSKEISSVEADRDWWEDGRSRRRLADGFKWNKNAEYTKTRAMFDQMMFLTSPNFFEHLFHLASINNSQSFRVLWREFQVEKMLFQGRCFFKGVSLKLVWRSERMQ